MYWFPMVVFYAIGNKYCSMCTTDTKNNILPLVAKIAPLHHQIMGKYYILDDVLLLLQVMCVYVSVDTALIVMSSIGTWNQLWA